MGKEIGTSKTMYNEIYEFLNLIGNTYINKLPPNLYEFIEKQRDKSYNFSLDTSKDVSKQLSNDSLCFIAYLNLKYWCDAEEKEKLLEIYSKNTPKDISKEAKIGNEIFFERIKSNPNFNATESDDFYMIEYKEKNIFRRVTEKIVNIFTSFFRRK